MTIAAVANSSLCGNAAQSKTCYLLSQTPLLGSRNSLDFLQLAPMKDRRQSEPLNLPAMALFGLVHPECWRYVRVRRRPGRRRKLLRESEQLKQTAVQEWMHPLDARALRVVVSSDCMPFLLEVVPKRRQMLFFGYKLQDAEGGFPRMDDGRTEHTGCPLREGQKWIATMWYREGMTAEKGWEHYRTG